MKLVLARVALVLSFVIALGWNTFSGADNPVDYENLIWLVPASPERVAPFLLERVRSFDAAFRNAYPLPLSADTTQIVVRSTPLKDSDGVEYEIELFVTVKDGEAVLTLLNIAGDLPDLEGTTLTARLLRAVIQAMDDQYKRKPSAN
jgi:hypothetical protein